MLNKSGLTLADLTAVTGGRYGIHDVPCPMCGPDRHAPANRIRRVLRIWLIDDQFATYSCARCGAKGEAHSTGGCSLSPDMVRQARAASQAYDRATAAARLKTARFLWRQRRPLAGTVAEHYLRVARAYHGALPATLGFLPPRGEHPPAMIAAFGLSQEPDPGRLQIEEAAVQGVHVTRLARDGTGKADGQAKIVIGRCVGAPIVLAPMNDGLGLAITEGIEDALSIHEATGLGAWAAGAASRLAALAATVPQYVDAVSIVADADLAGERGAAELQSRLRARRINVATRFLAKP
jgi:hypothetical protein